MHNKSNIILENLIQILDSRKNERLFTQIYTNGLTNISSLSNVWKLQFKLDYFCDISAGITSYSCSENHPHTKDILQWHVPKNDPNSTLYYTKHGVCLNSESHRNLLHLNVRNEESAHVTNRTVLLSFHKQYCVVFSIKKRSIFLKLQNTETSFVSIPVKFTLIFSFKTFSKLFELKSYTVLRSVFLNWRNQSTWTVFTLESLERKVCGTPYNICWCVKVQFLWTISTGSRWACFWKTNIFKKLDNKSKKYCCKSMHLNLSVKLLSL